MDEIAIRVEGLGKRFRLRHQNGGPRYRTLREELLSAPRQLLSRLRQKRSTQEEFWALKDVSFEVKRGEVLGIIGRNGAGKSTLLKILSRIMDPTAGEATVYGRIGSLLEVGTGFHPELTGRENIYLSGALLGMKRDEVKRRFDEIVEFAGVEKFLDTACKHYSSGMYTRLGFAVAAHLDTEILLVDEVLAVGDAEFQRKCLGKMGEVARGGRTVLLVSHNLSAIRGLSSRTLWLDGGRAAALENSADTITRYFAALSASDSATRSGLARMWLRNSDGYECERFSIGDTLVIYISLKIPAAWIGRSLKLAIELSTSDGLKLANMIDADSGFTTGDAAETVDVRVVVNDLRLYPDDYVIGLWAGDASGTEAFFHECRVRTFTISDGGQLTGRALPRSAGLLFLTPQWQRMEQAGVSAR